MDRREALRRTTLAVGGVLSAGLVTGVLEGCTPEKVAGEPLAILSDNQVQVLEAIADRIIPRTETAGAADVPLASYMDRMLDKFYLSETKDEVLKQLAQFMDNKGSNFTELDNADKDNLISMLASAAKANDLKNTGTSSLFHVVKEMTFIGFFSSEIGAKTVLQYELTPGGFQGCMPLEEAGGRTWAL
jgi:hypothetical protein